MNCALCNGPTSLVIRLEPTPPANELLLSADKQADQDLFDLNLTVCDDCNHLQLDTEVQKERLFSHYVYVSDTGPDNREHFKEYAEEMESKFKPNFVVDVGSNDGLFLSYFKCKVLGVDPAANIDKKVTTLVEFFNQDNATAIARMAGKADLITCNNMFAHNRDLSDVCNGIKTLLSQDGTFVFEVSYAIPLLKNNLFDLIYHEHYHHWHVSPMVSFFQKFGLQVVHAETVKTHGGSIRVFVKHQGAQSNLLQFILAEEKKVLPGLIERFKKNVAANRTATQDLLKCLNYSILGYPAKACTLSYFYGLKPVDVFDDNELKIGKYTHSGHKIKSSKEIYDSPPDYLLILSWNYAEALMEKHKNFKGKFIVPFPEPRIVDRNPASHFIGLPNTAAIQAEYEKCRKESP